jgi:hypothetical protein
VSRSRLASHTPTACVSTGRPVAYESHRSEASLEATFYIRIEIEDTVAPHVSMASFHLVSATSEERRQLDRDPHHPSIELPTST